MLWKDQIIEWKEEAREIGLAEGRAEGLTAGRAEGRAEGLAEGKAEGLAAGRAEGQFENMKNLIEKKLSKGKTIEQIADELESTVDEIQAIINKK